MLKDYFEKKAEKVVDRMEKTPARKLIIALLVIVSIGIVGLGYLQLRLQLEGPFLADKLVEDKARIRGPREFLEFYEQEQENREDVTRLQQRDSDGDGLTDYQEIYIYKTSAYNSDSDSDGISDQEEVSQGSDPNCPEGEECDTEGFIVRDQRNRLLEEDIDVLSILQQKEEGVEQLQEFDEEERERLREYFQNLTPSDLRTLLQQQGFPVGQLESMTNEDLEQALQTLLETL